LVQEKATRLILQVAIFFGADGMIEVDGNQTFTKWNESYK
jgi:hypothetical protein